jgi:hypothetical protein
MPQGNDTGANKRGRTCRFSFCASSSASLSSSVPRVVASLGGGRKGVGMGEWLWRSVDEDGVRRRDSSVREWHRLESQWGR